MKCNACFCPAYTEGKLRVCLTCGHGKSSHPSSPLTDSVPAGKADTSKAAFESIRGKPRSTAQTRVLAQIEMRPDAGATNEELCDYTDMSMASVTARSNELMRAGYIVDSGRRRKNRSGRNAKVWTPVRSFE